MGIKILESLNLRPRGLEIVSCPSCGRCQVDVLTLANDVTDALKGLMLRCASLSWVASSMGSEKAAKLTWVLPPAMARARSSSMARSSVPFRKARSFSSSFRRPTGWPTRWTPPGPLRSRSPEVRTRVRQLDDADLSQTIEFLSRAPVANVFLLSRIRQGGLDSARLGCPVHGVFRGGELVGLVHIGANLVPVIDDGRDSAVVDALASKIGRWRRSSSIMGADVAVLPLYERLARSVRTPGEGRVRCAPANLCWPCRIGPEWSRMLGWFGSMSDTSNRTSGPPLPCTPRRSASAVRPRGWYRRHMLELVRQGRGLGIVDDGDVRWKSDVAVTWGNVCQIQGVWMDPAWRGRGLAAPAMAAVVELARRDHDTVSLYVNDFNTRALRTYRRVGFERIGTMATLLY